MGAENVRPGMEENMKKMTFGTKRVIGAALAALTVVAGMSAMAFAGEPPKQIGVGLPKSDPAREAVMEDKAFVIVEGQPKMEGFVTEIGEGGDILCTIADDQVLEPQE